MENTKKTNANLVKHPEEVVKAKPIEKEKTLLIWEGPERPFKLRDRKYYTSMISISIVLGLFLFFAGHFMLIIALFAILFASYALYSVPPKNISYVLSDVGVYVADTKFLWGDFVGYNISKNLDQTVVNLELGERKLMKMVYLIPNNVETLDSAQKIVAKYVPEKVKNVDTSIVGTALKKLTNYIRE